jgi:AMP phosphorylase
MVKLKVKFFKLSAGRPVAILHKRFAEKSSIHVGERIYIEKKGKKIVAVVDIATGFLTENEVAVSTEISSAINLREGNTVDVELAVKPESLDLIYKKLLCKPLNRKEFKKIMSDIVKNKLTEAEIAYFVSAVYTCGMSMKEIINMTKAIVETGKKLKLKGEVVDKHSTGGIPGRTTPIIVSICSSAGLLIPKTSSRAITSPAGTADAVEVICRVDFDLQEIKEILKKTGACLVWGGSLNLAPADDKIIYIEKLLNLDPEAQLLASIIAKKLAVSAKYILVDIPYGKNTKLAKKEAGVLERKFKKLAKYFNLKLECFLKKTEEPLGNGIGPALEISDVIKVLRRQDSCYKLEERSLELAGRLLELTGKAKKGQGIKLAKEILDSGSAFKKFKQIIRAQKGKIRRIKKAKFKKEIKAEKKGKIKEIKTKEINSLARIAGCPLDKFAGLYLHKHVDDKVKKGENILTIYSESLTELREALKYYKKIKPIRFK